MLPLPAGEAVGSERSGASLFQVAAADFLAHEPNARVALVEPGLLMIRVAERRYFFIDAEQAARPR